MIYAGSSNILVTLGKGSEIPQSVVLFHSKPSTAKSLLLSLGTLCTSAVYHYAEIQLGHLAMYSRVHTKSFFLL